MGPSSREEAEAMSAVSGGMHGEGLGVPFQNPGFKGALSWCMATGGVRIAHQDLELVSLTLSGSQ